MNAKGKTLLKVVGILNIIFGIFGIIGSIMLLLGGNPVSYTHLGVQGVL